MLDLLARLGLGVRASQLGQGEIRLLAPGGAWLLALTGLAIAGLAVVAYRRTGAALRPRDRAVLTGLRLATLALLALMLQRPALVLRAAVPHQNVVAVLVDTSRSMAIADVDGGSRAAWAARTFSPDDGTLHRALAERFTVRTYTFDSTARPVTDGATFAAEGGATRIGVALDRLHAQLAGLPLAGIVVVSDGADTGTTALTTTLQRARADGVPLFTVGVGAPVPARDVQMGPVTVPRRVLAGSTLTLEGTLLAHGYAGQRVSVDVVDDDKVVGTASVTLGDDGAAVPFRVRAALADPGPRLLSVRVPTLDGEPVAANNARPVIVEVRDRREKVLYFEGEPRFEVKFLRRALQADRQLQLVVLQRTADNKYLRLDVDGPEELAGGFPTSRDELFAYRGVVLGSIEASAFSGDQLQMIADFVDRRGGGLLALGGPRAFSEGGYADTSVGRLLPFVLRRMQAPATPTAVRLAIRPTRDGLAHPLAQIAGTDEASANRWDALPPLSTVNSAADVAPGATVVLQANDGTRRDRPVLATQRFGRGHVAGFLPQDLWLWQMHASMSVEDQTHEQFARQLLRWLVDGVPDRVELTTEVDHAEPGDVVPVQVDVHDAAFLPVSTANVTLTLTAPDGTEDTRTLTWTGTEDGRYRTTVTPTQAGWHDLRASVAAGAATLEGTASLRVGSGLDELHDIRRQTATLSAMADATGGRFYTTDTAAQLLEDIRYTGRGVTAVEERELWQGPLLLVLLAGLLAAEWGYRRAVGLA